MFSGSNIFNSFTFYAATRYFVQSSVKKENPETKSY